MSRSAYLQSLGQRLGAGCTDSIRFEGQCSEPAIVLHQTDANTKLGQKVTAAARLTAYLQRIRQQHNTVYAHSAFEVQHSKRLIELHEADTRAPQNTISVPRRSAKSLHA